MAAQKQKKKNSIGNIISTVLLMIALGVFVYAGYQLITIYFAYKTGVDEYKQLNEFVQGLDEPGTGINADTEDIENPDGTEGNMTEEEETQKNAEKEITAVMENPVDFASLCEINNDVIGWLKMEAIDISYPLVQGEDNDYYLHRTFQRTDNFAGSIFMDYLNDRKFSDENTILYGHNMKNGSMFGILKEYGSKEVFERSPYFWIYTPDYIYKYKIFSCDEVEATGDAYQIDFNTEEDFLEYLYKRKDVSWYDTGVKVSEEDKVITLSTCTGNEATRFIVQGKRVKTYKAIPKKDGYKENKE